MTLWAGDSTMDPSECAPAGAPTYNGRVSSVCVCNNSEKHRLWERTCSIQRGKSPESRQAGLVGRGQTASQQKAAHMKSNADRMHVRMAVRARSLAGAGDRLHGW